MARNFGLEIEVCGGSKSPHWPVVGLTPAFDFVDIGVEEIINHCCPGFRSQALSVVLTFADEDAQVGTSVNRINVGRHGTDIDTVTSQKPEFSLRVLSSNIIELRTKGVLMVAL